MRRTFRRLKERHGVAARRVAVRAQKPWYWRALAVCILLVLGYALGAWHFASSKGWPFLPASEQDKVLLAQLVLAERQLQIERAAQQGMQKEMAALQDEVMRLKEDVAFYNSILSESGASGVVNLHSVKVDRGEQAGEYRYRILLVQSGRHDKTVQGVLRLTLQGSEGGKSVVRDVALPGQQQGMAVKFKYYQRIDGKFTVPAGLQAPALLVEFNETGGKQPKLNQLIELGDEPK